MYRDIAGTAEPVIRSNSYKPHESAKTYAICPSCQTLYLGPGGSSVICCKRHVNCAVNGDDEHCVTVQNECPVEFAYRVVSHDRI